MTKTTLKTPELTARRWTLPHVKWALGGLFLPVIGGLFSYQLLSTHSPLGLSPDMAELTKQATPELPTLSQDDSALVNTVEFVVRRNDTMERIFRQLQLDLADLAAI